MNLTIRSRLILFNLGIILGLVLVFGLLGRNFYRLADLSTQEESVSFKTDSTALALKQQLEVPLATEDFKVIEEVTEPFTRDPDLIAVRVTDADGLIVYRWGEVDRLGAGELTNGESTALDSETLAAGWAVAIEGAALGGVTVAYGLDRVHAANRWMVGLIIAILAAALIAAAASLWFSGVIVSRLTEQTQLVAKTAHDLKASAAEILAVAKQTETNSADEAAAVDETRKTMHSLLEASAEIAEAATTVASSAESSARASEVIADRNATLNRRALKITDISETIRGIADKSDILALNASLEGVKAGELGRGFVLVGQEMRRLAETITAAVREIQSIAKEIGELAQGAVIATEEGQKQAYETLELSKRITLITGQQRSGTEQVTQSMDEIQQFTQHSLAGAREAKSTAGDLVRTAASLGEQLAETKAEVGRSAAERPVAEPA